MGLTVADVRAVRAQWEEWVPDPRFELSIEIEEVPAAVNTSIGPDGVLRLTTGMCCHVQISRSHTIIFDDRVPYDAMVLRASVSVLARAIAEHQQLAE